MASAPSPCERMPSLTGLRFVAAFGVYLCHAVFLVSHVQGRGWVASEYLGPVAVSLFFVLSGFVLTRSARPADTPRAFLRRRVVKIYPNHLVVLALVVLFLLGTGGSPGQGGGSALSVLPGVLLVHTWLPRFDLIGSGNIVAWSLACEVFFYLAFPLLLPLVRRIPRRRAAVAAGVAVAAVWTVPVVSYALGGPPLPGFPWPVPREQVWFAYFFPLTRLPEFVLGMILAAGMRPGRHRRRIGVRASAALLLVSVVLGAVALPPVFCFAAAGVVPLVLLVRATAALDLGGARSPLRSPVMVLLGDLSYAFYLVHTLALQVVYQITGDALVTAVLGLPASVGAAWLLHAFVEQPCMRRFAHGRAPVPVPVAQGAPTPR